MNNLLEDLKANNIGQSVYYYGTEDLATGWEIKEIVDHASFFESFYEKYLIGKVESLDEYIAYLYTVKFSRMGEMIPRLLQDEHKEIIKALSDGAGTILSGVNIGNVIRFINEHIEEIFCIDSPEHVHDIRSTTLSLIKKYIGGVSEKVLLFLCDRFSWLIIDNFEAFAKTINNNPTLFEILYPRGSLSSLQMRRFNASLEIFADILGSKQEMLKGLVNNRIDVLCTDVEALVDSVTIENVMMCEGTIRNFMSFLQRIKHPKANDFTVYYERVEEILFEKIEKTGQHAEYEIPVGEIIERYKTIKKWVPRLLWLTHHCAADTHSFKMVSNLVFEKEKSHSLADFCSTNIPTDDYFTYSHQHMLNVHASVGTGTMLGVMNDPDVFQDFTNLIVGAMNFVTEQMNRPDEHLVDDWDLLCRMLQTIIANREVGSEALQPLCYGAMIFACSLLEKVLRLFYIDRVKQKTFVPIENATLGQLLNENNKEIVAVFGDIHVKHLAFFLLKTGDKKIGHNYRNRLAHWSEIKNSMLTVSLVAEMLWLFVDILNTVFIYYIQQFSDSSESVKET